MEGFNCGVVLTMRRSRNEIIREGKQVWNRHRNRTNDDKEKLVSKISSCVRKLKKSEQLDEEETDIVLKIDGLTEKLAGRTKIPHWRILDRSIN